MYFPAQRRRGAANLGVLLLVAQVAQIGLDNIPPVTLGVVAICTVVHLQLFPFIQQILAYGASTVCFSYPLVVAAVTGARGHNVPGFPPLFRAAIAPFVHLSDMHLYYNCASWLVKARWFEQTYGSTFMVLWLFTAVFGTAGCYVALCFALSLTGFDSFIGFDDWLDVSGCAIGLSGVIFALKTVLHAEDESRHSYFFGAFTTQAKYAVWLELVLIQFVAGGSVSFLGHLAGIMLGLLCNHFHVTQRILATASSINASLQGGGGGGGGPHAPGFGGEGRFRQAQYSTGADGGGGARPATEAEMQEEARRRWEQRYGSSARR